MTETEDIQTSSTRLIPVTKWPDYHPWPSVPGLRSLIFFGAENGFDRCIRRIGSRVLICERSFFEWCDEHRCNAPAEEKENEL